MSRSARREFLKVLASGSAVAGLAPWSKVFGDERSLTSAAEALDVFDLEAAARRVVPPAHWGYVQTGVDGDVTLRANQAAFSRYDLRPRRFVDVSRIDLATEVLGMKIASPIFLCPVGSLRSVHPDGELAAARAAKAKSALQVLSTVSSCSVEDVTTAREAPVWYQLYTTDQFDVTKKLVQRAEAAGCPVVAVTVDLPAGRNLVTYLRMRREDTRVCKGCHAAVDERGFPTLSAASKPMFAGIETKGLGMQSASLNWDFIKRLKDATRMKVVIKGIDTREDAELAVRNGADGLIVSNHGGRATETGRASIEALPEVIQGTGGRIPVLFDSGVRRGSDVYKALALGAKAVGIGRAYVWGLGAFGQSGVERALDILNTELRLAMVGCGARSVREISSASLIDRRL